MLIEAESRQAAFRALGNLTIIEEQSREAWRWPRLESVLTDFVRALRKRRNRTPHQHREIVKPESGPSSQPAELPIAEPGAELHGSAKAQVLRFYLHRCPMTHSFGAEGLARKSTPKAHLQNFCFSLF
jgi:hypothetical protein